MVQQYNTALCYDVHLDYNGLGGAVRKFIKRKDLKNRFKGVFKQRELFEESRDVRLKLRNTIKRSQPDNFDVLFEETERRTAERIKRKKKNKRNTLITMLLDL